MNRIFGWSQAGGSCRYDLAGTWWALIAKSQWPDDEEARLRIFNQMKEPYGDRRQEIVLIGMGIDWEGLKAMLDKCLLTDEEMALGPEGWRRFLDPFSEGVGV
jgi:hypothetical protein